MVEADPEMVLVTLLAFPEVQDSELLSWTNIRLRVTITTPTSYNKHKSVIQCECPSFFFLISLELLTLVELPAGQCVGMVSGQLK